MLSIRRVSAVVATVAALSMAGFATSAASACAGRGGCGSTPTPEVDGQTITVRVTGTLVSAGGKGSGGGGSTTVTVTPPCHYFGFMTGEEYFEYYKNGPIGRADGGTEKPYDGYEEHKDKGEGEGLWYAGVCKSVNYDGDLDGFFDYARDWFAANPGVFVEPGESPPIPPIPPQMLLEAALDVMTLPDPTFDWNPRATAQDASLVNLDTWFWLEDAMDSGSVTAEAGPNTVTVEAVRERVRFSAPNAGAVDCADGGLAWSAGATSDCTLTFLRSSGPAGTPVEATASWGLTWSANGVAQGSLDPVTATDTAPVRVLESQALVRRAGS